MTENDRDFVAALEKGLLVIESFDRSHAKQTLSEVARHTGMTRAAARRYLLTLVRLGYAESDGKLFWLVPKVLSLGYALLASIPFPKLAQPILDEISNRTGEVASLAVREGHNVMFIAHTTSHRLVSAQAGIGMRIPMYCSAAGKAIMASMSDDDIRDVLTTGSFPKLTPNTKTTYDELWDEMMKIRANGYAISNEELEIGLLSMSTPIPNAQEQVNLSITVSMHAGRMTIGQMVTNVLPHLQEGRKKLMSML